MHSMNSVVQHGPRFLTGIGRTLLMCVVPGLLQVSNAAPTLRYVAQAGQTPDTNSPPVYTSWTTAASNIQAVVDIAVANDIIHIGPGTYTGTGAAVVRMINKPLQLIGAEGPEHTRIDAENVTGRRGIEIDVRNVAEPPYVRIEGLTVTKGHNLFGGAGIFLFHEGLNAGTAIVHNCVIEYNRSPSHDADGGGGGLYSRGNSADSRFLTQVTDSILQHNIGPARRTGGGGGRFRFGQVRLHNFQVLHNVTSAHLGNHQPGGGLEIFGVAPGSRIDNSRFEGNIVGVGGGAWGGGLYVANNSSLTVANSRIQNNQSDYGAGLTVVGNSVVSVYNTLVSDNYARSYGGGIGLVDNNSLLTLVNTTIASNQVSAITGSTSLGGGGIRISSGSLWVTNTIVYHNIAPRVASSRWNINGTVSDIQHSCVGNYTFPGGSVGNLSGAPRFVDLAGGDFRLTSDSPCRDAGINQDWMVGAVDLDGRPRIAPSGTVDMGAFEWHPPGTVLLVR